MVTSEQTARELLDVVPLIMREIRSEMRSQNDLTVPQFRVLTFVDRNKGASLSEATSHMGLKLPSVCRLVDGLITRGLMTREEHPKDRRRIKLTLTQQGLTILENSRQSALTYLSNKLESLCDDDREIIVKAMETLRLILLKDPPANRTVN